MLILFSKTLLVFIHLMTCQQINGGAAVPARDAVSLQKGGIFVNRSLKPIILCTLSLLLCLFLAGCGNKAVAEYKDTLTAALTTAQENMETLSSLMADFDGTEESLPAIADAIAACQEDCQSILAIEAPEKAAEGHALVSSAMESYGDAMELYGEIFSSLDTLREDDTPDRADKAQSLMNAGSDDLAEAAALLDALN